MITRFAKIFFAFIFIVTISACDRKSCNNVTCPVGQACNNGQCYCADGYEGTNCDVNSSEKYVAGSRSWTVTESCNGTSPNFFNYNAYFQQYSSNPSEIEIVNLFGSYNVTAYIRTDQSNTGNIIEIPHQNYDGSNTVSGDGTYNTANNRIIFNLNYTYSGISYQCTHTFY